MRVTGQSMSPTLQPGDLVFVNTRAYHARPPRRGELVAARPSRFGGRALVKRIVGLPGEQLDVEGKCWHLGEGEFFLLGDQPKDSQDSRVFSPVTRLELIGQVRVRLWPWRRFVES